MLVSIIIPCYQERAFIRTCLDSVRGFEIPGDVAIEILVIDGQSTDGTREIIAELAQRDHRIRLIENPRRIQSSGLNIGIGASRGDYVVRLDAHSHYPTNYLILLLETARRTGADNVGGVCITEARGIGYGAAIVQALTTHKFGVGDSGFRVAAPEGEVDTVPYGCFRREVFARIGLFDERLVRCQDYELNRRLIASGGRIWLNPAIQVHYFQQPTVSKFLRKQIVLEAPYNPYMWFLAPYSFAPRHAVTGVFAFGVLGGLVLAPLSGTIRTIFLAVIALYAVLAVASAAQQARRYRRPLHLLTLPVAFFMYHFLHGIGVLYGVFRLAAHTAPVQRSGEPWAGAGRFRALETSSL
jgi:glycosyltransferase involved in cell wall biosynthesis